MLEALELIFTTDVDNANKKQPPNKDIFLFINNPGKIPRYNGGLVVLPVVASSAQVMAYGDFFLP